MRIDSVIGNAIVVPRIGNRNILWNENVIKEEFFFNEIENGNGGYSQFWIEIEGNRNGTEGYNFGIENGNNNGGNMFGNVIRNGNGGETVQE